MPNPYTEDIAHSRINLLNYTNLGMKSKCLSVGNPGQHFHYVHPNLCHLSIFTRNMWKSCYGSFLEALCIWQPYGAPNSSAIIQYEDELGPTIVGTFHYSRNSAVSYVAIVFWKERPVDAPGPQRLQSKNRPF